MTASGQAQLVEISQGDIFALTGTRITGLSSDGRVAVGFGADSFGNIGAAFRWSATGGLVYLDYAGRPRLADITADGSLMFGFINDPAPLTPGVNQSGVRISESGAKFYLRSPAGMLDSYVTACSDSGDRAFGRANDGSGVFPLNQRPILWDVAGNPTVLLQKNDGSSTASSSFVACAGDGRSGILMTNGSPLVLDLWTEQGGIEPLPAEFELATSLSHDGRFVFGQDAGLNAIRWDRQTGEIAVLAETPGLDNMLGARGCSADGAVAVGSFLGGRIHFWREDAGVIDLRRYAERFGADFSAYGLNGLAVDGVSGDGRVFAGGWSPERSWLLTFPDGWWESVGDSYCSPAVANSTGIPARLTAFGSQAVAENRLRLEAHGLGQNSTALFLTSQAQGLASMPGGSQGTLCLGGAIGRYVGPGQVQNSGLGGDFVALQLDLDAMPTPTGLVAAQPGETWYFQLWYRDSLSGQSTSNFTDAVSVVWQ